MGFDRLRGVDDSTRRGATRGMAHGRVGRLPLHGLRELAVVRHVRREDARDGELSEAQEVWARELEHADEGLRQRGRRPGRRVLGRDLRRGLLLPPQLLALSRLRRSGGGVRACARHRAGCVCVCEGGGGSGCPG